MTRVLLVSVQDFAPAQQALSIRRQLPRLPPHVGATARPLRAHAHSAAALGVQGAQGVEGALGVTGPSGCRSMLPALPAVVRVGKTQLEGQESKAA